MRIHFIAIGGSVMHQLAIDLSKKGYAVTGSDDEIFEPSKTNLQNCGLLPEKWGWFPEKISADIDAIILGMHAKDGNPELEMAKKLNLKIYSFPEYLFKESIDKKRIVIAGSHGKTSTTAMLMHILKSVAMDFDYMVGAKLAGFEQSVSVTNAPLIIFEGDEYPASAINKIPKFHFLFPHIAVITGIAWDHINVFPTFEIYKHQFVLFINKIEPNGTLIYNATDKVLKELIESNIRNDIKYIPYQIPNHTIENGVTTVEFENKKTELQIFGEHNLLNLNAAFLVAKSLNISTENILEKISTFKGAANRLELIGKGNNNFIFRDFAHAPSKVSATVHSVRNQFPTKKIIAVFELHTYSSLNKDFLNHYANSLQGVDDAIVFYSSHALALKQMPDLNDDLIRKGFNNNQLKVYSKKEPLEEYLLNKIPRENIVLLLMSSGNFENLDLQKIIKKLS